MKKALIALAAIATSASALAQGTITFFNNNIINPSTGATYRAGIFRDNDPTNPNDADFPFDAGLVGAGAGISVGLFLASDPNTVLKYTTGADAIALFRTANNFEVMATTGDVVVTGVAPGATANLIVRAWTTSYGSYTAARNANDGIAQYGEGAFTSKALGGTNPNPPPPSFFTPDMAPFSGFEMDTSIVPEPSTYALAALGLGALFIRRRK
jgi:hypothetical protein